MATTPTRWAKQVDWAHVLRAAGADIGNARPPLTIRCPICFNTSLSVYDDRLLRVPWLHCPGCSFSGDVVEWYSRICKSTAAQAIWQIAAAGDFGWNAPTMEVVFAHARQLNERDRLKLFWTTAIATGSSSSSGAVFDLLLSLGASDYLQLLASHPKIPRLLGKATATELNDLFFPGSFAVRERANRNGRRSTRRGSGPGRRRILVGHGWDNLVVVQFHDLPGRLCGLFLIGRDADPAAGDLAFKAAGFNLPQDGKREAGLAFASVLDGPIASQFHDVVFILTDPLFALRLQMRWLRGSLRSAPIVASYSDDRHATRQAFQQLDPRRRRIIWGPRLDDELYVQARFANANVAVVEEAAFARASELILHRGLFLLRDEAIPWRDAVRRELASRDPASAAELLRKLDLPHAERWKFLQDCNAEIRAKLSKTAASLVAPGTNAMGQVVIERDSGWFLERTGKQVFNATLRIESRLIRKGGQEIYRGTLCQNGREFGFLVAESAALKHGLLDCVRQCLRDPEAIELTYTRKVNHYSEMIALDLHPPKLIRNADVVGLDGDRLAFPGFSIGFGKQGISPRGTELVDESTPARELAPPVPLTRQEMLPLRLTAPETAAFWGIISVFAHNLVAKARHSEPTGLVITGRWANDGIWELQSVFGCCRYVMPKGQPFERAYRELEKACSYHGWPTIVIPPPGRAPGALSEWLANPSPRNCLISLNQYSACVAAVCGWRVIHFDDLPGLLPLVRKFGRSVLLNYLRDLCSRHVRMHRPETDSLATLNGDLAHWAGEIGRGRPAALEARELLGIGNTKSALRHLVDLLRRLVADGDLRIAEQSRASFPRSGNILVRTCAQAGLPAALWIPQRRLDRLLIRKGAPPFLPGTVRWACQDAGAFVAENEDWPPEQWLAVDEQWFERQVMDHINASQSVGLCSPPIQRVRWPVLARA
jgi:hypothetical protein